MLIFGNDKHSRGCFREVMGSTTLGRGAFLNLAGTQYGGTTGAALSGASGNGIDTVTTEPFFINAIGFSQKEKYHLVQCFKDRTYTYAFGHDPQSSLIEVRFTMFLAGSGGTEFGEAMKTLITGYSKARLSKNPEYSSLTIGSVTLQGFVVGMNSATQDPEHNLQSFTIVILVVEAQNG